MGRYYRLSRKVTDDQAKEIEREMKELTTAEVAELSFAGLSKNIPSNIKYAIITLSENKGKGRFGTWKNSRKNIFMQTRQNR